MSLKLPIEVRSVKNGHFTIQAVMAGEPVTAEIGHVPHTFHIVKNMHKAMVINCNEVDIRQINLALREPNKPTPELTTLKVLDTTE